MLGNRAARVLAPTVQKIVQKRMQTVVSGPPTQHVSTAEKIMLEGGDIASLLVVPAWVVYTTFVNKEEKSKIKTASKLK